MGRMTDWMSCPTWRISYRTKVRGVVPQPGNFACRRTSISKNFMRQPTSRSSHRSRHEGLEARVGVWGDAAGTAPAVTSVRASAFYLSLNLAGFVQSPINCAPDRRAFYFWLAFSSGTAERFLSNPVPSLNPKIRTLFKKSNHASSIRFRRLIDFA